MVHVAIVGAYGSAGVAAATELLERAAELDVPLELTLVDGGDPGGGLCILEGCMPSKDVLSAAEHRFRARHDDRLEGTPAVDLEATIDRKDEHVERFARHRRERVHRLAERDGVEFVRDAAQFVDDRVLAVGDREIRPDYVVIATGSTANVPDLPGIDDVDVRTSADVLSARSLPDSGLVMGFGYVGLELVPYLSEVAGMDLTVVEHDDRPLSEMPPAYGETLLELYRERFGVEIRTEADERAVEPVEGGDGDGAEGRNGERAGGDDVDGGVRLVVERDGRQESHEADALFAFTGRRPNLEGLGLERTSLEPGPDWVGSTMQARDDERVFVVGDANGREPILHVAKEQGFAAAENVLRHSRGDDLEAYANVPHHVVFSGLGTYPFARVGHTPATAAETAMDPVVVTHEAANHGVFGVKNHPEGLATLVVNRADGSVLGYQGLHLHADVMAKTMQLAVEMALDVREIPNRAYHPTTPEVLDGLLREACAEIGVRQRCVGDADDPDI